MSRESRARLPLRLTTISFVLLLLVAVGLLMWLSREYHRQFDWTSSGRNTLSEASIGVLEQLSGPVHISAFVRERKDLRTAIQTLVQRYRNAKPDIELTFVNPDTDPARTRDAGVQAEGELLVEYGGRRETVRQLDEETLTNALARLGKSGERLAVFLGGHGERNPQGRANFDLGTWGEQLRKRGIKTQVLVLGEQKHIPADTSVLVIAGPRTNLLPGEVKQIDEYVDKGGNLLWLADPDETKGLAPLAEKLGIEFEPGMIVDPTSQVITGQSALFVLVTSYPNQAIVKGMQATTVFPEAVALRVKAPEGWEAEEFLTTLPSAWSETGSLEGEIKFDQGQDVSGPLTLGVALTRDREQRQQRIAVVGDGDFLANTYLGNGGNLELGMKLVNWVVHDDAYISIPTRTATDQGLTLSRNWQWTIFAVFLLAVPLGCLVTGTSVWLRRRKR